MMRRLAILAMLMAASLAASPEARAEWLVVTISRHQVLVTSNFTGTSIVLFGTVEPDTAASRRRVGLYNLVVTVTGPKENITTRRKERVLGIWTNMAGLTFNNVPSYLAVLANRPFEEIVNAETLRRIPMTLDQIVLPSETAGDRSETEAFRANFLRLKQEHRLYAQRTNGVTLLTPTVFRAEIPLPAQAAIGNYDVDIKVFAENLMVARATTAFEIVKVGFEQFVATAARDYGLLYGLATAMMAIFTGWFASVVFRRD
jgi:uncharacterized protein (TIGR02186 family)